MKTKCKNCKAPATMQIMLAPSCSLAECKKIIGYSQHVKQLKKALALVDKKQRERKTESRKKTASDRERIKSISKVCSEAQRDVNAMIRAIDSIDYGKCIATKKSISDAGHFIHAGTKYRVSWLRFFHGNIHGQGSQSNRFSGGGDNKAYTKGLIERYGADYIDQIEHMQQLEDSGQMPAPTREEIKAMRIWCRAMTRLYLKQLN